MGNGDYFSFRAAGYIASEPNHADVMNIHTCRKKNEDGHRLPYPPPISSAEHVKALFSQWRSSGLRVKRPLNKDILSREASQVHCFSLSSVCKTGIRFVRTMATEGARTPVQDCR